MPTRREEIVFKSKPLEGIMEAAYFDPATRTHFCCRFDTGSDARNNLLWSVSHAEVLPQKWAGTSVMAVARIRELN